MLVDDGEVECEKIGSSCYYWSFPSKQAQGTAQRATSLSDAVSAERTAMAVTNTNVDAAAVVRPESEARSAKLQRLSSLKTEISVLEGNLDALKENDPAEIEKMDSNIVLCRDSANRWTDNLLQLRTWLVKKKGMSSKEAANTLKQMGVTGELEYVS